MPHHVHIAYATRFGQTGAVAERLADRAREAGHTVSLGNVRDGQTDLPAGTSFVVVAGAVYSNQHDEALLAFLRTHRSALEALPAALVSVSLAKALDTEGGEDMALDYVEQVGLLTGFEPAHVAMLAGALNESAYDAPTKALLQVATWRAPLAAKGDVSFTDWDEVDGLIARWLR